MWDDIIEREKRLKIVKTGAQSLGLGVGLFVLQFFFGREASEAPVREAFSGLGLSLLIYGLLVVLMFAFHPERLRTFYLVSTYLILPVPLAIYIIDIFDMILKD